MRRKPLTFLLAVLCFRISCYDSAAWIGNTDRFANPVILEAILRADEQTASRSMAALVDRTDFFMEDIILGLLHQHTPSGTAERCLLALLDELIRRRSDREIDLWILENADAFEAMARQLLVFEDPYLRKAILSLLPRIQRADSRSWLMAEGDQLLRRLTAQNGYLGAGQMQEMLQFFDAVRSYSDWQFMEICISIVEQSRQKRVVSEGRALIRVLLEAESESDGGSG